MRTRVFKPSGPCLMRLVRPAPQPLEVKPWPAPEERSTHVPVPPALIEVAARTGLTVPTASRLYALDKGASLEAFCDDLVALETNARDLVCGPGRAYETFEVFCVALISSCRPQAADIDFRELELAALAWHNEALEEIAELERSLLRPRKDDTPWERRFVRLLALYARACDNTPHASAETQVRGEAYRSLARMVEKHGVGPCQ